MDAFFISDAREDAGFVEIMRTRLAAFALAELALPDAVSNLAQPLSGDGKSSLGRPVPGSDRTETRPD